ncbi:flavodoxin-like fold protein [Brettanomyces nanus]|uniref:Flavodoxin-like fold protein n=1 Tax=Eeniella nana TaxID=13502 RepID=A0A875SBB5_EENNA|nr:flavodoxin-like fold protein [Brettanomyces nanus]QPG77032.1 flavodoxin-like fold protein [Brettanomyces nanus]
MTKIAIIIYSLYHHVSTMAEEVKKGVESVEGCSAEIFQVPETLSKELLEQLGAPERPDYPIATLETLTSYDAILFGMPTRFGAMPAQMKAYLDGTGGLWANGSLYQKPVGVFVSTGTGSGREFTVYNCLSAFAHHGMIFVPLGFAKAFPELANVTEPQGGSAWGAGCLAGGDGSRNPSKLELRVAEIQGHEFADAVKPMFTSVEKAVAKPAAHPTAKPAAKATTTKPATKTTKTASKPATKSEKKRGFFSRLAHKLF